MQNGLAIYGGFVGNETMLSQRDWMANETILSGDIDGDGMPSNNSFHVVFNDGNSLDNSAVLDGFTVSGGNADDSFPNEMGGGIFNRFSSPVLTNCIFRGNMASFVGGGMYNESSTPTLTNCTFQGNSAVAGGGGMFNALSSPTLTNCIFWGNGSEIRNLFSSNPTVSFSTVQGGYPGTNNLNVDPLFVDAANGDLRLQPCSPAIDAGDAGPGTSVNTTSVDLPGNPRFFDNGTVDMGAYEYQFSIAPVITSVSPEDLSCEGGTILTITGTNLCDASLVTIGGSSASNLVENSANELLVTVPAGSGTAVPVQVTTPSGSSNLVGVNYVNCCNIAINSVAATDETCSGANDGTLTITATCGSCSGGNTDIRYSVDNSDFSNTTGIFSGLASGSYTVYVRDVNDHSCTDSDGPYIVESNGNCVPDENCSPDPLVLNDVPISGGTYRSVSTIQSAGTVAASSDVLFTAGESITFMPGFTVEADATFTARIEGCIPPATNDLVKSTSAGRESDIGTSQRPDMKKVVGTEQFSVFPNPFRNQTTILLSLTKDKQVGIRLFDLTGKLVSNVLTPTLYPAGANEFVVDGSQLAPAVYILAVQIGEVVQQQRLVVMQ